MFDDNTILQTLRVFFGLSEDVTDFDNEFLLYLGAVLSIAKNLGIDHGIHPLSITPNENWPNLGDGDLNIAFRSWVCLKVKRFFDPPKTQHHINSFNNIVEELEQTLCLQVSYLEPLPEEVIVDE